VHSFTGTATELRSVLDLGYHVGVNGCSMKTEENLEIVKQIPLERMCIETDCPYCEIRKSSAAYKYLDQNDMPEQLNSKKFNTLQDFDKVK